MTDKQWYAMIDVHTTAPFRILREAAQFIRDAAKKEQAANGRANARKVVNVTSVSGVYGNAGQVIYSTAKAGITDLPKTLAKDTYPYIHHTHLSTFPSYATPHPPPHTIHTH